MNAGIRSAGMDTSVGGRPPIRDTAQDAIQGRLGNGLKVLLVSESPLTQVNGEYFAVDSWIRFPLQLAEHCNLTLWAPVESREHPVPDAWRFTPGRMRIRRHDGYHTYSGYYRRWPTRVLAWRREVRELLADHDVIVLRLPSPMAGLVSRAAKRAGVPLVTLVAGDIVRQSERVTANHGFRRMVAVALVRLLAAQEVVCCRRAALVYAYSDDLAERHDRGDGRVRRMRTPHVSERDFADRLDTCGDGVVKLLRVSWLTHSKGIDVLLRALALLVERGVPATLAVVGQERRPGYQDELAELAERLGVSDRVEFHGHLPFDRIDAVYRECDIQVVSSLAEGFPRCIAEGCARGLPLVSTTAGGCGAGLTDRSNALLVEPGDADAMAAAIERVATDGDLRRRLIQGGFDLARSASFERLGIRFLEEVGAAASGS